MFCVCERPYDLLESRMGTNLQPRSQVPLSGNENEVVYIFDGHFGEDDVMFASSKVLRNLSHKRFERNAVRNSYKSRHAVRRPDDCQGRNLYHCKRKILLFCNIS